MKNREIIPERIHRLQSQIRNLNGANRRWKKKCEALEEENHYLKLQIEEYRQKFFKKKSLTTDEKEVRLPRKRGAPKGHPGTTRKKPKRVDRHIDVHLQSCPQCGAKRLKKCRRVEDHLQEDIVLPKVEVTRFRHHFYYCPDCKEEVCGVGPGELPSSYIGPVAKSVAAFLHYQIKVPYRKIQRLFSELFHLDFVPSSGPGFDRQIRVRGDPIYEKMKQSLPQKTFVHVDETGWRLEGRNQWLWCFAAEGAIVYRIDPSRGAGVVHSVFGKSYSGVLISDFLAAYNRIKARKQRCLVHLLRLIKKWQIYFQNDRKRGSFFSRLKGQVKEILKLSQESKSKDSIDRKADLIARFGRMLACRIGHPRADKFIKKLSQRFSELITCLELKGICAHNNWAERLLRDSVIMRKITFGNRSPKGIRNHEVLMSLIQTARSHHLNPFSFLQTLLTNPTHAATSISIPVSSTR